MDEQKEILQYFNLYYYFGQLTQNSYQIKHTPYALKNKSKIEQDIESFYKKKNEDKHITEKLISIITNENGEKILRIKPSKQLRTFARNITSKKPYLSEYNLKKLIKEHEEEIQHLKTDTEKLKFFIKNGFISFNQKFILALNTLNLTIVTKDSKVITFIYPLEYIELDEYNSAILTGVVLSTNKKGDNKKGKEKYLLEDEHIEIKLENLPIIKNEFIFNKFLPTFPKEKPKDNEDEYPTLSYLINKSIDKIELKDIENFLLDRTLTLKKYLIKNKEDDFIERIDIPQGVLNYEKGLILFKDIQESQINFDLIIKDKLSISDTLKTYLQTDFNKKVHYQKFFSNAFTPYYGTNTKEYPLAKGQSKVLENYVKKQSLIPVIGAPGTGKTTLFKSIIANNITSRALSIIYENKDYNNLMLMTSTARKAVDNVIKDIEEENPFMGALVLLSKDDSQQENRRAKALSQFLKPIQEVYEENIFNSEKFTDFIEKYYGNTVKETKDTFLDAYEKYQKYQIEKLIKEFSKNFSFLETSNIITTEFLKNQIKRTKEYIDNLIFLYKNKEKLNIDINTLNQELKELENELKPFIDEINFLIDRFEGEITEEFIDNLDIIEEYQEFFLGYELTSLLDEFELAYNKIKKPGIIGGILNKLLKKEEVLFKNFKKRFKLGYLSNNEFLDTLEEIKRIRKQYNTYLKKSNQAKELHNIISFNKKLENIQKEYNISINEISKYKSIDEFYRLAPQIYKANYLLYKLSESFLILDAYEIINKEDLTSKLSELKELLELNKFKDKSKEEIEQSLIISSRFFPVIGATNKKINLIYSSAKNKIKNDKNAEYIKFYHTILIDEAGMIPSADAVHSINIGKQALIVGDPKQLEPIPEIPDILLEEFESYVKKQNPNNEKYHKMFSASHFSAYDVASGVSLLKYDNEKSKDFIGNAYLLDEHRRCQKDIAELFIKVADYPKDLKIKTKEEIPEYLLRDSNNNPKYLEFYNCKLTEKPVIKNTNPLEIEAIEFILKNLEERGIDLSSQVGIITPFLNQATELIDKFGEILGHSNNKQKIGTVHKFQGAEFDVIIFSSVLNPYSTNKAINFVGEKVNLLNVSVSRAKKLYIHIGDMSILKNSGKKPMIKYMSHFNQNGLIFDFKEIALKKLINEIKIEKSKHLFKEFSEDKKLKIYENLNKLKHFKFEDEYFYNSEDIAKKMCELISNAKQSILFIVPWIRESALEYIQQNANLTKIKNGEVKINFRVLYHKNEKHKLKKIYPKLVETFGVSNEKSIDEYINKISVEHGTHEKIMIVDREKIFMGSFNFLSSGFYDLDEEFRKKTMLRDEIAVLKGPYDVWCYLLNRQKTIGVKPETLYQELEKFVDNI